MMMKTFYNSPLQSNPLAVIQISPKLTSNPLLYPKPPICSYISPPQKAYSKLSVYTIKKNKERVLLKRVQMASNTQAEGERETKPFSVLFVCLGNICRSPAAEGVFSGLVKDRGLISNFHIDSAGTIGYHEGDQADPRMRAAAKKRGVLITSLSRPIKPSDFRDFDLILAMDRQNKDDILGALERWRFRETLPDDAHKKVQLMCSYCKKHDESEVPDPYYGGPQGFEKVLDLLEDACESLLDSILAANTTILNS